MAWKFRYETMVWKFRYSCAYVVRETTRWTAVIDVSDSSWGVDEIFYWGC
jgi:hypothetical protein